MKPIESVCIVGAGAIGSLFAGHLGSIVRGKVLTRRAEGEPESALGLVKCPRCGGPGAVVDGVSAAAGLLDALRLKGRSRTIKAKVTTRVMAILARSPAFKDIKAELGRKLAIEELPCGPNADVEVM